MPALSPPRRGRTRHECSDGAKDGAGAREEGRGCPQWPHTLAKWGPTPPSSRGDSGGTRGEGTQQPKQ